ncbi:lipocalin-like domain-containing protein [Methylibium sp.]|uniref:lipocalin-like domain-containing protein n=1 Tax=Methylibium sp. TaxID=2067992 RepID=UPI003D14C69A
MNALRLSRRALLFAPALGLWSTAAPAAPVVRAGTPITLPRDFGSHPDFRTEWWYVTGWLDAAGTTKPGGFGSAAPAGSAATEPFGFGSAEPKRFGFAEPFGFQVTFFRSRTDVAAGHPSRFAAQQLLFAHAALTDPRAGRLRHDQRIARAGFGIAEAALDDTDVRLRGWQLVRSGGDAQVPQHHYRAVVDAGAQGFAFDLRCDATQPVLLQGDAGHSRKGPAPEQASHYLSEPQLAVGGTLRLDGKALAVTGRAWLDHEWSEALLHPDAVGWDWTGMNLDDGGALTAFRLRRADGSALWAGGSFRPRGGAVRTFGPDEVRFTPLRRWRSPATQAEYPVEWRLDTPAGAHRVRARLDAQELDSRGSTGSVYWEGLSELLDERSGARVGRGYLEMTGYASRLQL